MDKLLLLARLVAALPLLGIGIMHLSGSAPMLPILEGAGLPMPELTARLAPMVEILAGALLLTGFLPRIGGLLAFFAMSGALASHLRFDHANFAWPDEPPLALPILVMALALLVAARGPGMLALSRNNRE